MTPPQENNEPLQRKMPSNEWYQRMAKLEDGCEVGAGFEAHKEPEKLYTLLGSAPSESRFSRPSYQTTQLEKILLTYVAKKITGTDNPFTEEGRVRELTGLDLIVDTYIDILDACERKTPRKKNDKSLSYFCVVHTYHGHNIGEMQPHPDNENIEQRLKDLEELRLINGQRFSFVATTNSEIYENGQLVAPLSDRTTQKFYRSYIATEKGTKLLEEHRKIKSAGK